MVGEPRALGRARFAVGNRAAALRLGLLLAVAGIVHLVVLAKTTGDPFDLTSMGLVNGALHGDALHVYSLTDGRVPRWPYPPGFFPFVLLAAKAAGVVGVSFDNAVRLPGIAADLALAWLVWAALGWRGASEQVRLVSAAAVALGPIFLAVSADHGQVDAVAILFAFAGLVVWERLEEDPHRALYAGLLIGAGAAIKSVPILLVLALLPWARSRREAVTLTASAIAVPFVLLLPFLVGNLSDTLHALRYHGGAGIGGLSLLAQPQLAVGWLAGGDLTLTGLSRDLQDLSSPMTLVALGVVAALLVRYRPRPEVGAALLILALYVFGVNFYLQYALWGLPFFLLAGWLRTAIVLQALYVVPLAIRYGVTIEGHTPASADTVRALYVPAMIVLWESFAVAFLLLARRVIRDGAPGRSAEIV